MRDRRYSAKLVLALGTVYLVWGSSFLFTKIAVSNLPPALFSGIRFVTAGVLLTLIARFWNGDPWPVRLVEWRHVTITGFFMVLASNGLNTWAIQYLPSNESALLNGTAAFWIAGLGVFGPRGHPLKGWAILGLCIGFLGAALMLVPNGAPTSTSLLAQLGALAACLCWSLGTLYYRSIDTRLSSLMFMALQMFMGGLMLLAVAVANGDSAHWTPNAASLVALCYLTFFSSCLAYTAYGWLTVNSTPALIGTYGYVNPAIAAFCGWQFLHERLSRAAARRNGDRHGRSLYFDAARRKSHGSEDSGGAKDPVAQRRLAITSNLPLPPTNQEPTKLTRLTSSAVQKAAQKPITCMPGSIQATSATMPALITSKNSPRVTRVMGRVSTMAMGRTMELTTPNRMPARINVVGVSMNTPLTQAVASQRPSATRHARMRNPSMAPPSVAAAGKHTKDGRVD